MVTKANQPNKRWAEYDKVKCNCGHYPKDHFNREGVCSKCGCTWYYPNDKFIRTFSDKDKRETYEKQNGICTFCKKYFEISEMEADHITPWSKGGKTITENCQMLCLSCNRTKGAK